MGDTPRERIAAECESRGAVAVREGCVQLYDTGTTDPRLLCVLGGRSAGHPVTDVWLRVWALRGLLWSWPEGTDGPGQRQEGDRCVATATDVLVRACGDEAWRCREMALRVAARHRVDALLDQAVALRDDRVPRVRAAAERCVVRLAGAVSGQPG